MKYPRLRRGIFIRIFAWDAPYKWGKKSKGEDYAMQAKRKTQPYDTFEPLFDGSCEVPIDMEYDMPDYCADIQKILKCRVVPELSSYAVSEDALRCEGVCDVRVLYLDAQGDSLRCCDFTKEFSATIQVKAAEEKAVAWVRASVEHITCRAVNARRLDLHLAVSLKALAVVQRQGGPTSGLEGGGIQGRGGGGSHCGGAPSCWPPPPAATTA